VKWIYSVGYSFIIAAFLSAALASYIEDKGWY